MLLLNAIVGPRRLLTNSFQRSFQGQRPTAALPAALSYRFPVVTTTGLAYPCSAMSTVRQRICSISDLKDGEKRAFQFGDEERNKILLARVGDKWYATSNKCSHYGAPLSNGVLTNEACVTCPWHGAKFSLTTGDIEDAPGLSSLHVFKTSLQGTDVFVEGDPQKCASFRHPSPSAAEVQKTQKDVVKGTVVVGGGSGTIQLIETLRENGYAFPIIVLSAEPYPPIDRTKLSKALIDDPSKLAWRSEDFLRDTLGVDFHSGVHVDSVDIANKKVNFGGQSVHYDTLVLATGGKPRRLPVKGADANNVFTLRTVLDAKAINQAIGNQDGSSTTKKKLVIVGTSFIGMELANATFKRAEVHIVGIEKVPFEGILGPQVGEAIMKAMQKNGISFHTDLSVGSFSTTESNTVNAVHLTDGTALPADAVVLGVGVAPATDFLKGSGLELEKDGSIKVDELLRVPGKDGVFALGDIATYPSKRTGMPVRIEHWNVAGNHGRSVGHTVAGKPAPFQKVPIFWSALGAQLRYCGSDGPKFDDVFIDGNAAELKFAAYYFHGETVVAVSSMGRDPLVSQCSELLRIGKMPTKTEIKSGKDPLAIDISSSGA